MSGYFQQLDQDTGFIDCVACRCNGHGSMCNAKDGSECECDPEANLETTDADRPCATCVEGFVSAGKLLLNDNAPLQDSEPCFDVTSVGAINRLRMDRSKPYSVRHLALPAFSFRPGDSQRNLDLRVSLTRGQVAIVYSSLSPWKVTTGESVCDPMNCYILLCDASGCRRATQLDTPIAQGLHSNRSRRDSPTIDIDYPEPIDYSLSLLCDMFDFYQKPLFISVVPVSSTAGVDLVLRTDTTSSNPRCVRCVGISCFIPCREGWFRDPAKSWLCTPCMCNGHGDVCNVINGGQCGMKSEGCSITSGRDCQCAHNTESSAPSGNSPAYMHQCNSCKGADSDPIIDGLFVGSPTDGRQCYFRLRSESVESMALASRDIGSFFVFRADRYTNVDLRVILDVWSGSIEAFASGDANSRFFPSANVSQAERLAGPVVEASVSSKGRAVVQQRRHRIIVSHSQNDFADPDYRLYVSVVARSENAEFSVYSEQNLPSINLIVFFQVFFASFFLLLASIIFVTKARGRYTARREIVEQALQLEEMSRRPRATINVVFRDDIPYDVADQLIFQPSPMPQALRGWCVPTPIAEQPLSDGRAGQVVATYLVELPGMQGPHLQLGATLCSTGVSSKRKGKRHRSNSRVATSAL